jgi:uracil-DNA glycosylase
MGSKISKEATPAYRQGDDSDIKTIILLSAPGSKEESLGRPAAGETRKTLQAAIERLHKKDSVTFPSSNLDDYTIANAVETIHYMAKTGRTEAPKKAIINSDNIKRIDDILNNNEVVLALGSNAQYAVKNSNFKGRVLAASHPSMRSLNRKYKSDKETPHERKVDRISQWVYGVFH